LPPRDRPPHPARLILILSLAPTVGLGIGRFAYALVLPDMRDALGWSYSAAGFMNTINAAGYLAGALVASKLIKRFGLSATVRWGTLACVASLALCAITGNFIVLSFARLVVGLGAAAVFIAGAALAATIAQSYPERANFLLSLFYAGQALSYVGDGLRTLAIPLLVWQWFPAVDGIAFANTDPSTRVAYYRPLLAYLGDQGGALGRVEIPSTYRHWEAAYAAPHVLLARGWERQLDIAYNPIFYSDPLTGTSYHSWLHANGVKFVALPDARLDDSSVAERALISSGLPYLQPVWHDAHWRVWQVDDFAGLVDGPATLQSMSPDRVTLTVSGTDDLVVRIRATSHWAVHPGGCAASTDDGWTRLHGLPLGTVTLTQSLAGTPCPS